MALSSWPDWVKRRVESVEFLNAATIVRRVSIDFRVRSWLPKPKLDWYGQGIHYLPLALLDKQPLQAFDLRDESDTALPLLTRRKNASIAAGALVTAAQFAVYERIRHATLLGPQQSTAPLPDHVRPVDIALPDEVEEELWQVAWLNWSDPSRPGREGDANRLLETFYEPPALQSAAPTWRWRRRGDGCWEPEGIDASIWRWQLIYNPGFRSLAQDFARLFMVTVPIPDERKQRRIIKLCYQQHLDEPELKVAHRLKTGIGSALGAERWLTSIEDRLEDIPTRQQAGGRDEWTATPEIVSTPTRNLTLWQKLARGIGWGATTFSFDVPAVGEGGSFHFEVQAPEGLQIRRASLSAEVEGQQPQLYVRRGARNLQRVHLYLGAVPAGAWGSASVSLKARASTMIRGVALASLLVAAGLLVSAVWFLDDLRELDQVGPAAAILLIVPGLLALAATRPNEHPLTNGLLFGVRLISLLSGACAVGAAAFLVAGRDTAAFCVVWWMLAVIATTVFVILGVAWRLAARRRPSGGVP